MDSHTQTLESALVVAATNYFNEAKSYSECNQPSGTVRQLAEMIGYTVDAFLVREMTLSVERCNAITGLAHYDSDMSSQVKQQLLDIEEKVGKLKAPGADPDSCEPEPPACWP